MDLVAFRRLVGAATAAAARQHHEAALDHYVDALGLWQGPAGGGIAGGTSAAAAFAVLDDEFYDACSAATEQAVSLGRPERVLRALRLATSMAPFHEPVHAGLVSALGAAGRQAEALAVFRAIRDRLADELGVDPGPALEDAHRRVLAQPSVSPPSVDTVDEVRVPTGAGLVGRIEELAVLRRTVRSAVAGARPSASSRVSRASARPACWKRPRRWRTSTARW
ncbi:BTAD domain-containing putative transcriptional regulator [Micromonospora sp. M12]